MNPRETACLGVAAALAFGALAGDAHAEQQGAARSPARSPAKAARAKTTVAPPVSSHPLLAPESELGALTVPGLHGPLGGLTAIAPSAGGPLPPDPGRVALQGQSVAPKADDAASPAEPGAAQTEGAAGALGNLFGADGPLELIQSVIVPAARGVTIAEIQKEGAPTVTLSVRPTKITRGSGLVAAGKF